MMRKILCAICVCLLTTSTAPAGMVSLGLDLPAAGNHVGSTVTTSTSSGGATFDITYVIAATSNFANPYAHVAGTTLGVGSDGDIVQHFNTLEGDEAEGLSFTSLTLTNFNAGTSSLTVGDFTDLQFNDLTFASVANARDGVNISFTGFGVAEANQPLHALGTPYTQDLKTLSNFSPTATGMYIQTDNAFGSNRWNITGLSVSYVVAVPEPSSLCMMGLCSVSLLTRRRKRS